METKLYAKLIDGQLITTCVPDDDPDTLALILADGFKPYDDSAPMPETDMLKSLAPTVAGAVAVSKPDLTTDINRGANVPVFDAGSKLDAGGVNVTDDFKTSVDPKPAGTKLNAVPLPVGTEVIDPATVVPAASGPKIDITDKFTAVSFAEPVPAYRDDGERIVLEWKIVPNSPAKVAAEITRLQSELAATDYQVVKCYEFVLAGEMPPYDPAALHTSRQALRDRIAELEALMR